MTYLYEPFVSEAFEEAYNELLNAEVCPDCELDSCEYRELCEYIRASRGEA